MPNNSNNMQISAINLLVKDYQEAADYYVNKLGFTITDDISTADHRWLTLSPNESSPLKLIMHKAENDLQLATVGKQAGDAVLAILQTDNFQQKYTEMQTQGVEFCEQPRIEPYGTVVIFKDLYGNRWDLIEPAAVHP